MFTNNLPTVRNNDWPFGLALSTAQVIQCF
jgi:hypothetical protein